MTDLVKKAKAGDKNAFNSLILEYQDTLYRIAKARLNSEEDVCDAVQNTLISAYKSLKNLKNDNYFKTWIIRILINECNDFYARQGKDDLSFEVLESHKSLVSKDFTNNFNMEYLIEFLSKEEQTILTLYYAEDYNEKEIAKILGIKYATIRTKIKRAKEKIALKLREEAI